MTDSDQQSGFERIYSTDLVYVSDCWKLCGDAHCCNFQRYKSRFKIIGRTPFQELPLLPGEYEFLSSKGWLEQFGDFDHKVIEFPIDGHTLKVESIVSRKPNCACEHGQRPLICRLYPLLPIFDVTGRFLGAEPLGIYEEMERIAGLEKACRIESLPFDQINQFTSITSALGGNPVHLYYLEAYRVTKHHVAKRLAEKYSSSEKDLFALFEMGFIRGTLIDSEQLRTDLSELARLFEETWGDDLQLGGS